MESGPKFVSFYESNPAKLVGLIARKFQSQMDRIANGGAHIERVKLYHDMMSVIRDFYIKCFVFFILSVFGIYGFTWNIVGVRHFDSIIFAVLLVGSFVSVVQVLLAPVQRRVAHECLEKLRIEAVQVEAYASKSPPRF